MQTIFLKDIETQIIKNEKKKVCNFYLEKKTISQKKCSLVFLNYKE